jgi:type II secretory pathway pseudopilin PulG
MTFPAAIGRTTDRHPHRRSGYTLLEVSLYVTFIGVLGASFVSVLRGAYRAQQETATMLHQSAQLHRFSQDWVRDVHAARQSVVVRNDSGEERLQLVADGDNTVEYWAAGDVIRRVQRQDDELVHQETYKIGDATELEWVLDDPGDFVEARLWRITLSDAGRVLRRQFIARLAANWRFAEETP